MKFNNLLIICNTFPDNSNRYVGSIFIKEQIKYLKNYFENVYVISPAPYGIEYLRKTHHEDYQFDNVHIYFPKYFNFPLFYFHFRDLWVYLEKKVIYRLLKEERIKFDLIHAHDTSWPPGRVAVEIKKEMNVPVVITEHTSLTFKKVMDRKDSFYVQSWEKCDAIIRVNKGDLHLFKGVGIPLEKVQYIPNGYDSRRFTKLDTQICRKKLNLPSDKKIVLNVGNLYEVKGHKYLIEAIKEIVKQKKDILCIIVGRGKLKSELENRIKELSLCSYVKFAGGKPYDEIPLWINACDAFVLPSLAEGNPTVMFECLGCGKPFIGTRVGGIPEVITNEKLGYLVEPKDVNGLANGILEVLSKEWDKDYILNYAKQFTWDEIAKKIMEVYNEILER